MSAVAIDKARMDLRIELLPVEVNELANPAGVLASPVPMHNLLFISMFLYV